MHNMTAYCFLFLYLLQELQAAFPVQNYTAVVQSIETVDVQISETYQWKTGSWSACDTRTRCGEGHKTRRIWCMSSSGFIVSNSNCNSNLRPSTVKHCLTVCDHHKYELRWRTSDWSPCNTKTINHCSGKPVTGIANRTVECVLTSENVVVDNEACEYFWDKPESEMACSVDCPQLCVTAKRNITCRVQECSKIITQIEEVEDVIVAPNINGIKCSGVSPKPVCKKQPMKNCKKLIKGRKIYRKKITAWSPCISALTTSDEVDTDHYIQIALRPLIGFSRRNITCIDEEGNEADMSFCLQGTTPPLLRQCVVSQNCKVSPWSEWHVEVEGCIATDGRIFPETRTWERKLIQLPVGTEAKPCPPLYEKRIITTDLRPCYK